MDLIIDQRGHIRCVYAETVDFQTLGDVAIRRASHVEPTAEGTWTADLSPVLGPTLGPYLQRSAALQAECEWLEQNWL